MSQCYFSILRNGNVPCHYFSNVPADLKVVQSCLSNLRKCHVALSNLWVKGPTDLALACSSDHDDRGRRLYLPGGRGGGGGEVRWGG